MLVMSIIYTYIDNFLSTNNGLNDLKFFVCDGRRLYKLERIKFIYISQLVVVGMNYYTNLVVVVMYHFDFIFKMIMHYFYYILEI